MVFEPCQEENGKDISKWGETGELNHKKSLDYQPSDSPSL
jgi:hypothetical protein